MQIFNQRTCLEGVVFCLLLTLMACSDSQAPSSNATPIAIVSLSNRADLVSGGDALLEIQGVRSLEKLTVDLNGEDVTGLFGESLDGRILGLVEGLQVGENLITAGSGELSAALTLTNHPRGGPVFSGPQIQPWICTTPVAQTGDADTPFTSASGLSNDATDEQCNIAAEVKHYYRTTEQCGRDPQNPRQFTPCFKPYDLQAEQPVDLAEIGNQQGQQDVQTADRTA